MASMDAESNGDVPDDFYLPSGWKGNLWRGLGVTAVIGMIVFWIFAFSRTDSVPHADEFDDPAFVEAAVAVCTPRQAAIAELPLATTVDNPFDRAELVDAGTAELQQMIDELAELAPPSDPQAADGVVKWLRDYEVYLDDRRNYSALLNTGESPAFVLSSSADQDGVRVTDLLTTFAEVNEMEVCGPSGDV